MKYITANKLIAEIEKKKKILISEYNELVENGVWISANENKIKINTISGILSLITSIASLQQEQPEVDFDEEFDKFHIGMYNPFNSGADIREFARHFYELGQIDAANKFDEIEYNRQREEKQENNMRKEE